MPTSTPSPIEQIASEINAIQTQAGWMQDKVRLKDTLNAVEDLQTTVNGMQQFVRELRAKGYVFEKELEATAADFTRQWSMLHQPIMTQINIQSSALQGTMRSLELKLSQLNSMRTNPSAAKSMINTIKNDMDILEDKVKSAESTVDGMYNSFRSQVQSVKGHLNEVEFMLDQLAEAKFTLLPTEGGLCAIKAVWCKDGKERDDDPEGILYLTDQRLLFEQKEEVATKKFLFITTEKQKIQELEWEAPVVSIEDVKPSKQGFLKNEDHLDIRFGNGAPFQNASLHIWQEGSEWVKMINRVKTKDFDKNRAVAIDQKEIDKTKQVPAQCPSCGANLAQVILRGQDSTKCEYCGFIIRL